MKAFKVFILNYFCELTTKKTDVLQEMIPGSGLFPSLRRFIWRQCTVSKSNSKTKKVFKSEASIDLERDSHLRTCKYMIHPFSNFRLIWETFMIVTWTVSLVVDPFYISFDTSHTNITKNQTWLIIILVLDILTMIDVIMNFLTGYYNTRTKQVCMDPCKLARNYIKGYFVIHSITAIPAGLIMTLTTKEVGPISYLVIGLMSLVKGCKIGPLLKYLRHFAEFNGWYKIITTIQWCYVFIMYFHWMSCGHFFLPSLFQDRFTNVPDPKSWVTQHNLWNATHSDQYLRSYFRTISRTFAVGIGRVHVFTVEDVLLSIFNIIMGAMIYIFAATKLYNLIKVITGSTSKYWEITMQLKEIMQVKKLPMILQYRVFKCFQFYYHGTYFDEKRIMNSVSKQLRDEIILNSCRHLVESASIFRAVEQNLLKRIVAAFRLEVYVANDTIVREGDLGNMMYFIHTGAQICHLEDGDHFGEIALVMEDQRRRASVIAIETSKLFCLSREDFRQAMKPYPETMALIKKNVFKHLAFNFKLDKEQSKK